MLIKDGRITSGFNEQRPLKGVKTHIHGAIDEGRGDFIVRAPVDGVLKGYAFIRPQGEDWAKVEKDSIIDIPFRRYWYDVFGGLLVLYGDDDKLHIMAHFWLASVEQCAGPFRVIESAKETRFPCVAFATDSMTVKKGQPLSRIGNAGYSTGPHVHYEIHNEYYQLDDYKDRIDPEVYHRK